MPEITKARTARTAHACTDCYWRHLGDATIAPGHRYLKHTALPGYTEHYEGTTPLSANECVEHAIQRGDGYKTGACQTFCHGDIPCARPERHDGDHSCRRCIERGADHG